MGMEGEEVVETEVDIDLDSIKVGDVVSGMKVELIGPFSEIRMNPPFSFEGLPLPAYLSRATTVYSNS